MSVNIFKNGILSKIAGAVGDAVPLINNFLTNQAGKGAADANTVYVLNNKIEELNSSLSEEINNTLHFPNYENEVTISEESVINYTATSNGYVHVLSDSGVFKNVPIFVNGNQIGFACNSLLIPVNNGDIVTTNILVRFAYFIPMN